MKIFHFPKNIHNFHFPKNIHKKLEESEKRSGKVVSDLGDISVSELLSVLGFRLGIEHKVFESRKHDGERSLTPTNIVI
jgi:hypothetical protein